MEAALDLGSRTVKVVVTAGESELRWGIFDTAAFYRRLAASGRKAPDLAELGIAPGARVAATGYGRYLVRGKHVTIVPEIKAHALGVAWVSGRRSFAMIDIGGQDVKVALVRGGRVVSFVTNDKCAAGTGRYLENAAGALGLGLEELSRMDADPERLSVTCAIFGESEMIGKLAEGVPVARIAAGANLSVARRIAAMLADLGGADVFVTGGAARNGALVRLLGGLVPQRVEAVAHPKLTGALGCLRVVAGGATAADAERFNGQLQRGLGLPPVQ